MMHKHRNEERVPGMLFALTAILGMAVVAVMYTFSSGISGNDFWWHIKVGEWIAENGGVPKTDIFSWYGTVNQIPWTAHEWLADLLFYWVYEAFAEPGVFVLSFGAAELMVVLLWKEAQPYVERNILIGGLFFALLSVTTSVFFYGRPHLFSFFLLLIELKILFSFMEDPSRKGIYLLPVVTCLWSNIHGGSAALSYAVCVLFLAVSLTGIKIGKIEPVKLGRKAVVKLLIVTVCSVAAILVNPVGLEVLVYPYKNFADAMQMTMIAEWRSPDAKEMGDLVLFICPVALMLIGFFAEKRKIRLIDVTVMCFFIFLFLRSVRFIMLWYIAAAFCGLPYVPVCNIKPMKKKEERILTGICLVIFACLMVYSGVKIYKTAEDGALISVTMSDEAVQAVREDAPERLFNDYNLGEALIYHEIPVFFDARADLYAYDNMMADGVSLMLLQQANPEAQTVYVDVNEVIGKYDFDAILILKHRALYTYLCSHPEQFACVYQDNSLAYFRIVQ